MRRDPGAVLFPLLALLMGLGAAIYLHGPALAAYGVYKADILQSPHWAGYHTTSFRTDDPIVAYAAFNESPVQNAIYWVGTLFFDFITLTKMLAVASYGAAALLFFAVGKALYGTRAGLLLAAFFTFFPHQFHYSAGFFSKYWMMPCLLAALFLLDRRRWGWLAALMPFAALAYPVTPVLIGMTAAVYLVFVWFEDRRQAWALFRALAAGSLAAVSILLVKYLSFPEFLGGMPPREELLRIPEMKLTAYVPIPSLASALAQQLLHPFVLITAPLYLLVLRGKLGWERSWIALLVASCAGYLIADALFMRLYIPNRYTRYSLALLLALWHARNWDLMLGRIRRREWRYYAATGCLVAAAVAYRSSFHAEENWTDRSDRVALCSFVRGLPEGILVAGPPSYLDDVMAQARRSVLVPHRLAHPWFDGYREYTTERAKAVFRAIYATDAGPINELHSKYGVTHLVTGESFYTKKLAERRIYRRPLNDWILREVLVWNKPFVLKNPPQESVLYDDGAYKVLRLPLPER